MTTQQSKTLSDFSIQENSNKFIEMIAEIKPVKSAMSSVEMVRLLREGKAQELLDAKKSKSSKVD
ncbi:MAG: hypothetical protein GQ569_05170 [Methylococcaceae bacterium]|nr:hypothetical protein [Methylococcaceae bacterium]